MTIVKSVPTKAMQIIKSTDEIKKTVTVTVQMRKEELESLRPNPKAYFEINNLFEGYSDKELKQVLLYLIYNLELK